MFWDPFEELERMHREIDRVFGKAFGGQMLEHDGSKSKALTKRNEGFRAPMCDIRETESNVLATFELPGADKKDIELNVNDDSVEVKVERKEEHKEKGSYAMRSSSFYRKLPLPTDVDANKAKANYKDGILRIEIPKVKKEKDKKKRIEIE